MSNENIIIGTVAIVKVGRNEVEVTVIETVADGWMVKSNSSGREFEVKKLARVISVPAESDPAGTPVGEAASSPAPESRRAPKKLSLLTAAAQVLKRAGTPLNCKEIIAKAVADGLWTPTGAKTPEQSLYSAMFREIRDKENPRFKKSETRKGSFEYNG